MWVAKHPLRVGGSILFLYIMGRVVVGFTVNFIIGVFLFLTGVSGMIVAFLYVVALCPNPIFKGNETRYKYIIFVTFIITVLCPVFIMSVRARLGFDVEMSSLVESMQWLRDPYMFSGLAEIIPFLGILLFLCIVRVVVLCGQQKQCLGGQGHSLSKRAYA